MKILFKVFFLSILLAFITSPAYAQPEADQSARLLTLEVYDYTTVRMAKKKIAINSLLKKYNSPLVSSIDSFLNTCTSYSLDCYLLPSIAGLESSFGKHVLPGSNNPFGWGGGLIIFDSWDQAIAAVGKGLKYNYIDREIGRASCRERV